MKAINEFIKESIIVEQETASEEVDKLVGNALKEFGSMRHGWKSANTDDIIKAMKKFGFYCDRKPDYSKSNDDKNPWDTLVFTINTSNNAENDDENYVVYLYASDAVKGKFKITNWNTMEGYDEEGELA